MEVTEWPHREVKPLTDFYHLHSLRKGDTPCHTGQHGRVPRAGQEAEGGVRGKGLYCV